MTERSYSASGINLKAVPMGEFDRLVTVLTKENGLVRAIAPGARKHKSKLAGRSGLFVVNDLLFIKGKSLDKLVQAETQRSFPGLSQDLAKLTASQYLAELVLAQALTDQPQAELYYLLIEHLGRLETATKANVLPCLAQATFHLLALAGVAPEVFRCCLSRKPLSPDISDPDWRVAFSVSSGGVIDPAEIERLEQAELVRVEKRERDRLERSGQLVTDQNQQSQQSQQTTAQESATATYPSNLSGLISPVQMPAGKLWLGRFKAAVTQEINRDLGIVGYLSAAELALMQQLNKPELVMAAAIAITPRTDSAAAWHSDSQLSSKSGTIRKTALSVESGPHVLWLHIEKFLRQYAQYQFERPIRSATLIDICFNPPTYAP